MRKQHESTDSTAYALVQEPHCFGHKENRPIRISDYRAEQGVEEYDQHGRGWRQLILKKKSSGPTVGKPSQRSLQLFFMACYDPDQFRKFVMTEGFNAVYALPGELHQAIASDDIALREFGFRLMRQVMFNEMSISDGRPEDYHDGYRGRYGKEDTRQALVEARRAGIHSFCITIDKEAREYLPHLYGAAHYVVMDQVRTLPLKVADNYRALTT